MKVILCGGAADGQRLVLPSQTSVLRVPEMDYTQLAGPALPDECPQLTFLTYRRSDFKIEGGGWVVWRFVLEGVTWAVASTEDLC